MCCVSLGVSAMAMETTQTNEIYDVIQRWRENVGGGLSLEDCELFKSYAFTCVTQGDNATLLRFLQDEKNQDIVTCMGCCFLAPLANEVIRKSQSGGDQNCQAAIKQLTEICSPQDVDRAFHEILEDTHADVIAETILVIAPHLQTVLLQMGEERVEFVGPALSAMHRQVSRLPVPYTQPQEASDEHGLCRCCIAMAEFMQPFVEGVKRKNGENVSTPMDKKMKEELLKLCMKCLREPLLQAQLVYGRKSPLWLFAAEILVTLPAIHKPLPDLLFYHLHTTRIVTGDAKFKESLACLSYLLFVQFITMETFPAIFSPLFILQCNMEYIHILLSRKDESYLLKGLALYSKSLERVCDNSLPVDLLELKTFYRVSQSLHQILMDCPLSHLRENGLSVFQLFINKLDTEAKHRFFMCTIKTSHHAGIEGYIIKNIKNQVEFSMKLHHWNKWFLGAEFLPLLREVLCLPQGAETDVLHSMDRIMEGLNLLRYLLIRDELWWTNTGVWAELCRTTDEYLEILRIALSVSRAYYAAELKLLMEDQKLKTKERRATAGSTRLVKSRTVRHERASSDKPPEVHHQILQSALVTFDLMESLIIRIAEIQEDKEKTKK